MGAAICLEWPADVTIRNNHFNRCREGAVYPGGDFMGTNTDTYWQITGNTFDWDTAEHGITQYFAPISLASNYNTVTGNTFIAHTNIPLWSYGQGACVVLWGWWGEGHNNTVPGNTFYVNATQRTTMAINGASEASNTIAPNTVVRQ